MLEQSDKYVGMTLIEAENAIIEEFSMYEEWLDKYEYLIELGKSLKDYPEEAKTDDKLIKGCQSRVWLDYKVQDGNIVFNACSVDTQWMVPFTERHSPAPGFDVGS